MWDLVMMTQKITKMTSHYAPKNNQNDQSMKCFSGKLSGHYDPKNDPSDQSLRPTNWPKWPVDDTLFRKIIWSLCPKKWPKWLLIMPQKMTKMTSRWKIMSGHDDPKNDQNDQSMSQWIVTHLVMMTPKMTKMTTHYGWLLAHNE